MDIRLLSGKIYFIFQIKEMNRNNQRNELLYFSGHFYTKNNRKKYILENTTTFHNILLCTSKSIILFKKTTVERNKKEISFGKEIYITRALSYRFRKNKFKERFFGCNIQ